MEETGKKLQAGEQMYLCGSCMAYGELMMAGAKFQSIPTAHGNVSLITSDDPDMVARIQKYGQKNIDEMAKYMQMEKAPSSVKDLGAE